MYILRELLKRYKFDLESNCKFVFLLRQMKLLVDLAHTIFTSICLVTESTTVMLPVLIVRLYMYVKKNVQLHASKVSEVRIKNNNMYPKMLWKYY